MVTSSTLFAQKKQKSYKSFDEIKRLISLKQRDEAVLLCLSILEKKPTYYDVRVYLGRIYSWEKKYDDARKELLKVLLKKPKYKEALEIIINIEMWTGNYLKALEYIDTALNSYPVNERFLFLKVKVLHKLDRTAGASETILELLELNPSHKEANEFDEKLKIYSNSSSSNNCLTMLGISISKSFGAISNDPLKLNEFSEGVISTDTFSSAFVTP